MKKKYDKEKIKEMFQIYRDEGEMIVTDDEYDIFCTAISFLDDNIVNKINKEIHFAGSSITAADKIYPACYINLSSRDLKSKKAIILFSELLFNWDVIIEDRYRAILHEIAHHELGHIDLNTDEKRKKADEEADVLAKKWMDDAGIPWPPDKKKN